MLYYAIAFDKENETKIIANLPETSRIDAQNAALRHCKKNNLHFKELRPVPGTGMQNGILTKTIESKRGRKFNW